MPTRPVLTVRRARQFRYRDRLVRHHQADVGFVDKISKHADGIRTAPTQAITASGRRPSLSRICASFLRQSFAETHAQWSGKDAGSRGAQHIVRGFITAGPVA